MDSERKQSETKEHPPRVEHNYHDHSNERETEDERDGANERNNEQNFPAKLHYMLSELDNDGMDHIVSWQPHGRCFVIHRQKDFVEKVLPL